MQRSFVVASYRKYDSLLKTAPSGFKRSACLASGAFYFAVRLMTIYGIIKKRGGSILFEKMDTYASRMAQGLPALKE